MEIRGPLSFQVQLDNGRILQQHIDHLRACEGGAGRQEPPVQPLPTLMDEWEGPALQDPGSEQTSAAPKPEVVVPPALPCRSSRVRRPPIRYS